MSTPIDALTAAAEAALTQTEVPVTQTARANSRSPSPPPAKKAKTAKKPRKEESDNDDSDSDEESDLSMEEIIEEVNRLLGDIRDAYPALRNLYKTKSVGVKRRIKEMNEIFTKRWGDLYEFVMDIRGEFDHAKVVMEALKSASPEPDHKKSKGGKKTQSVPQKPDCPEGDIAGVPHDLLVAIWAIFSVKGNMTQAEIEALTIAIGAFLNGQALTPVDAKVFLSRKPKNEKTGRYELPSDSQAANSLAGLFNALFKWAKPAKVLGDHVGTLYVEALFRALADLNSYLVVKYRLNLGQVICVPPKDIKSGQPKSSHAPYKVMIGTPKGQQTTYTVEDCFMMRLEAGLLGRFFSLPTADNSA
jgi:hypothetical protein